MQAATKEFLITDIPALLWGEGTRGVFIAVHGSMSSKTDMPIEILATEATALGYQVLSFDLPGHGDRKSFSDKCKIKDCVADLNTIMRFARQKWESISLFAVSMGAYCSMLSYAAEPLRQALFLSPVVDMPELVTKMMGWFSVTKEQLQEEGEIVLPNGQYMFWDDYQYITANFVSKFKWPAEILYGAKDELCDLYTIEEFSRKLHCCLQIAPGAAHYFHTPEEMMIYRKWLRGKMI